jgi:GT2 family glycosyltransferase
VRQIDRTALLTVLPVGADRADTLNAALAGVSTEYVVLVDADGVLADGALDAIQTALERFPETDLLYGDSVDESGGSILSRPIFSPIRLRGQDYLGPVRVCRTSQLRDLGGFRDGFDGAHLYDLALRLAASDAVALHVPEPLSISEQAGELRIARRTDRPTRGTTFGEGHLRAVRDHLRSLGIDATVELQPDGSLRLRYRVGGTPLVSLIIPTRGGSATIAGRERVLLTDAVRGILEKSTYQNLEVVVVADDDTPQAVIDELIAIAGDKLRLVRWTDPFNFSAKINRGAVCASGEYLVPLNDDIELVTPDWIEIMLGLAQQPGVGLVGTTLFFEDGTVQHAGHMYRDGAAGHVAIGWESDWDDRLGSLSVDREIAGVTAACAMLSADMFWKIGGFSSLLPGNYNDADVSMKIRRSGASIVWTPHVRLYHFESKSRVATIAPSEIVTIQSRWGSAMQLDPYWPQGD